MDEIEEAFRDGLRDAVSSQPAMAPIELNEILARAEVQATRRRPVARWVGLAAAVTLAAGLGLWAMQTARWTPTDARKTGTPGTAAQVRTLRLRNDTSAEYHQAALQLADGRRLPLGDVPAGGTVLVPLDATPAPDPSAAVGASGAVAGLHVVYSGDCSGSSGTLVAVLTDADRTSVQIVASPDPSTPAPAASPGSDPTCTITIAEARPSPGASHT